MYKKLLASVLLFLPAISFADNLPPASDFYYCALLYRLVDGELKQQTPLKNHVMASLSLFEAGAVILSGGVPDKSEHDASAERLRATIKKAADENLTLGEIFKSVDSDCWSMQRRYAQELLKKSEEVAGTQKFYFTHNLPMGQVDANEIAKRREFLKSQRTVSVDERSDVIVYSFSRSVGEMNDTAHHVFTKEGNQAHPAIIFLSLHREARDKVIPPFLAVARSRG